MSFEVCTYKIFLVSLVKAAVLGPRPRGAPPRHANKEEKRAAKVARKHDVLVGQVAHIDVNGTHATVRRVPQRNHGKASVWPHAPGKCRHGDVDHVVAAALARGVRVAAENEARLDVGEQKRRGLLAEDVDAHHVAVERVVVRDLRGARARVCVSAAASKQAPRQTRTPLPSTARCGPQSASSKRYMATCDSKMAIDLLAAGSLA